MRAAHTRARAQVQRAAPLVVSLLLVAADPAGLFAQEVRLPRADVLTPPTELAPALTLASPELSLSEAVRLTLLHSPQLALSQQDLAFALGRVQELSGLFDGLLSIAPGFAYVQTELRPFLRKQERDKRDGYRRAAEAFEEMSQLLQDVLDGIGDPGLPRCPVDIEFVSGDTATLDIPDEAELAILGEDPDRPSSTRNLRVAVEGFDLSDVCAPAPKIGLQPETYQKFLKSINKLANLGLDDIIASYLQVPRETLELAFQISEAVGNRARLAFERLGLIPEDEVEKTLFVDAGYSKAFRNGTTVSGNLSLEGGELNFRDKLLDPRFGGLESKNRFPSSVGLTVDIPLGNGRGRVSAAAPERAARLNSQARDDQLRQALSGEAFRTILAYFNLVAAQEVFSLLEESSARQREIVELTEQLVAGGEVSAIELERVRARAARVESSVISSRLSVLTARLSLAQTVGLDVTALSNAPVAGETFAIELPTLPDTESLGDRAVSARFDSSAFGYLREASQVLADAARADLKRVFDLSVSGGLSTFYESPFFRFLPDESYPIISAQAPVDAPGAVGPAVFAETPVGESPVQFYSPRGQFRAFSGEWKPYVMVSLAVRFPFGNNRAKGRFVQARASLRRSDIEAGNLDRVIRDSVIEVSGALRFAGPTVERRREAVGFYLQTLDAALQLFQSGEQTLVDVLLTEEDSTAERIQLVRARQIFYSTLARLHFETGELIHFDGMGTPGEVVRFEPFGVVTR